MKIKQLLKSGYKFLIKPDYRFQVLSILGLCNFISDEKYLKRLFKIRIGCELDLEQPQTFNEKMQWLKIHDRNPLYTKLVDKYEVKKYVADIIGEEYIIPTIGEWESWNDFNLDMLPERFVIKCNHNSGEGMCICQDKGRLDIKKIKINLKRALKRNYFWTGREWPYKNVPPRIIAEEYLENDEKEGLHDYKVWCFNGIPTYIQYITGRLDETYEGFFDTDWNIQNFTYHNKLVKYEIPRPACLEKLISLSRKLAQNTCFVRVDFYILPDDVIKFGELTFYPMSGLEVWNPPEMDKKLGEMLHLNY